MPGRDPNQVARDAVDPDRLLPGEHPDQPRPGDADHWIQVYGELRTTKLHLLNELRIRVARLGPSAAQELEGVDEVILQLQVDRFERRLAFWAERLRGGADS